MKHYQSLVMQLLKHELSESYLHQINGRHTNKDFRDWRLHCETSGRPDLPDLERRRSINCFAKFVSELNEICCAKNGGFKVKVEKQILILDNLTFQWTNDDALS